MATPKKNKVIPNTPQDLQSPVQGNSILPSATANNSIAAKKTTKPKQPKLPSAPKENVSIGVMNLDNPSTTKSPPLAEEEKNEKYRTWKPSARVSSSELFKDDKLSENILNNPQALQQHATNKLNSQFGDPARDSKDSDWKYKDEKLESLRDESYSAVESVINNKKFKIPENIREMFGKLGKSNWVSTGSARLAAHLRFNEQKDVREIAQLLEHATGESFTEDGTDKITTDQVGRVLDKFLSTRNHDLYQFMQSVDSLPTSHHAAKSAIKASLAMMGMYEEAKYALSLGENISGKKWYKDMVEEHDKGLAHLISNHADYAPISHIFGKVDNDGNWEKNEDHSHNMVLFKGILAPTSNAMNPIDNGFAAFNLLRAGAIEAQRDSRSRGLNKPVEMFDIINHMPETQAGFGKETDLRTYVKADINKGLTHEDIAKKWGERGYINSQTNLPFTSQDIQFAMDSKKNLSAHIVENGKKVPIATKWMMNQGGLEGAMDFYKKFINGGFNQEFENLGLHDFIVGNLIAENGAQLDLTTPQGRQDAVNKLSKFMTSEFDYKTLKKFKGVSDFRAPDLSDSSEKAQSLGKLPGSWIIGPKIGLFFQNMNNNHKWVTADMWVMRSFGRLMGSLFDEENNLLKAPSDLQNEVERGALQRAFEAVSTKLGLNPSELQAVLWYHEQQLWRSLGSRSESNSYEDFIHRLGDAHAQEGKYTPLYKTAKSNSAQAGTGEEDSQSINNLRDMQNTWGEGLPPFHDPETSSLIEKASAELKGAKYIDPAKHPTAYALKQKRDEILSKLQLRKSGSPIRYAQFTPVNGGMQSAPVSQRTNVPFGNAVAKQGTGKNIAHAQLNDQIAQKAGIQTSSSTAIGDWPNGSEQSTVHTSNAQVDPAKMRYLAAWHGLSGQKKSVLVFHPNEKGPDSLYHINHPETDLGKLREQLNQFNLQYKTLVPGAKGTKIMLFDPNKSNRSSIDQFATKNNLDVVENTGQGEIIGHNGDWNSAGALPKSRQAYNNIIAQYEQNQNSSGSSNNSGGTPTPAKQASTGETKKQLSKSGKAYKFNKARRILEGFLRAHNTPNKELPPVGFKQVRFLEVKSFRSLHQHGTFGIPKMITHLLHPKVFP